MQKISRKQAAKECIEYVLFLAEHFKAFELYENQQRQLSIYNTGLCFIDSQVQGEDDIDGLTHGEWFAAMLTTLKGG